MERPSPGSRQRRHVLILLVEDSPADVRLVEETLKDSHLDADLRVVANGVDAIRYLRQWGDFAGAVRPELILLDLSLPAMDGRQVLAEVRSDPALNGIPLVIFTSSNADEDVQFAFNFHADGYVRKPLTTAGLRSLAKRFGLTPGAEADPTSRGDDFEPPHLSSRTPQ